VAENASVVDGTVTWTVRKIGSGGGEAIGVIKAFAGNGDIPSGYLLCDGSAVSRTMFPDLFAAIGTTYGSGDGSTTFNVPDYNTAERFAQGSTVAGTVKSAGLPNITGVSGLMPSDGNLPVQEISGAFDRESSSVAWYSALYSGNSKRATFNASRSNPIYGNSDTVQPNALTTRFIIKAFDGQTADSALIDITQYAQELAGKANITGSNLVHHRDVITTSGTYTAPVAGLYKITIKGGGGGGAGSGFSSPSYMTGGGGGEGGTTIGFERMNAGDTATVVIGAGGTGGSAAYGSNDATDGGDSSVSVNSNIYTGGGGHKASGWAGGAGGSGTIAGASGQNGMQTPSGTYNLGGIGGGNGGSTQISVAITGGGGLGAPHDAAAHLGGDGGDGFAIFEYYTPGA
jgi:microcystin-dependent protein